MKLNFPNKSSPVYTAEGGVASKLTPTQTLSRLIATCLLWEDNAYISGNKVAETIQQLVGHVPPDVVAQMAIGARNDMKLRHVPLFLAREMARLDSHKHLVSHVLTEIIQRPDELTEFLAIYWKDKKQPLSAQVKKGLANAFTKFNEYSLAKYNQKNKIKLRDVLFLCHAKPKDEQQDQLWKKLINDKLEIPETWETLLSSGKDKRETFIYLMEKQGLGGLAFLRNLRNMHDAKVPKETIKEYANKLNVDRVLPFRFLAAANVVPQYEDILEPLMLKALANKPKFNGKTVLLVDVSGSMDAPLSRNGDLSRIDAGVALSILLRELCDNVEIFTFSDNLVHCAPRRGFALKDAIMKSQSHSSTYLARSIEQLNRQYTYDRLIILTDEQSHDNVAETKPNSLGYIINVATHQNGVGYNNWTHINGWSESIIDFIQQYENTK